MNKILIGALCLMLLSSCATILNRKTQVIRVSSTATNSKLHVNDSIYELPALISVVRSKHDLAATLVTDSLERQYTLKPSVGPFFAIWNLAFLQLAPVAYGVDLTNQKRFYYNRNFVLNPDDTTSVVTTTFAKKYQSFKNFWTKQYPTNKGQINLNVSIPYVTALAMQPKGREPVSDFGFLAISASADYFYRDNKFVTLSINAAATGNLFHAEYFEDAQRESMTSLYASITDNVRVRRFTFGYGLQYSRNLWALYNRHNMATGQKLPSIELHKNLLGLSLTSYYQISRLFFIGLKYNPSFADVSSKVKLDYEHTLSVDVMVKFTMKK